MKDKNGRDTTKPEEHGIPCRYIIWMIDPEDSKNSLWIKTNWTDPKGIIKALPVSYAAGFKSLREANKTYPEFQYKLVREGYDPNECS